MTTDPTTRPVSHAQQNFTDLVAHQEQAAAEAINAHRDLITHLASRIDDAVYAIEVGRTDLALDVLYVQLDNLAAAGFLKLKGATHIQH